MTESLESSVPEPRDRLTRWRLVLGGDEADPADVHLSAEEIGRAHV